MAGSDKGSHGSEIAVQIGMAELLKLSHTLECHLVVYTVPQLVDINNTQL